jgi:hypothetical protein
MIIVVIIDANTSAANATDAAASNADFRSFFVSQFLRHSPSSAFPILCKVVHVTVLHVLV